MDRKYSIPNTYVNYIFLKDGFKQSIITRTERVWNAAEE